MTQVLFVSKPVVPPWNDSSKNLVRDIAASLERHSPVLMGRSRHLGVFRQLLFATSPDIWHFFFAPNVKTSAAARFARAVRRVPSIHTVCSMPAEQDAIGKLLFADVTVALSRAAFERLRLAGIDESALRLIPPCVPPLSVPDSTRRTELREKHAIPGKTQVWIYPGDLEFGGGAEIALTGFAAWNRADSLLLMACRPKTARAAVERFRLMELARRWGIASRVQWLGDTLQIHELLTLSDFVVLVNRSAYAKMDYPLVALESMCLARPVLVGRGTPSEELAELGAAVAVEPDGEALAAAVERLSSDAASLIELGHWAHRVATSTFSPKQVAAAYEHLYEEIRA
jgi:phosphatidylinositol alpha-1,6-mannosyltransferase